MKTQATSPMANNNILLAVIILIMVMLAMLFAPSAQAVVSCTDNTITADVVVLDNPTVFNRLGAQNPNWITYALKDRKSVV